MPNEKDLIEQLDRDIAFATAGIVSLIFLGILQMGVLLNLFVLHPVFLIVLVFIWVWLAVYNGVRLKQKKS